jgi:NitT/TauT family transport system ATP-binding protein
MVALADRLDQAPPAALRLDLEQVSHGFALQGAQLPVLDRIDLSVAPGEFVALLGPSGCGKSTLLRLIAGLDRPSAGRLLADGAPIARPDPSRLLVFQAPTLYPWRTVRQNVALGLEARGLLRRQSGRIDAALSLVGLAEFADALPHQLSGGMAQRAALARALVNDPALLLLDEPLGQLDSLTRITMQGELVRLWQRAGFTAVMVTHDVEEALLMANRVVVFSERPARIKAVLPVDLPYPRHRDDPVLQGLRSEILALMGFRDG